MGDLRAEDDWAPGITKESNAWDVYNNEARKVDTEMVKDWRESLNSLLIFTAIFAAVLASFIIESKKMLEQDPTELLLRVTIFNTNNGGNASSPPFVYPIFEPTSTAISVNCFLFASLGASLVAALASVIALQWVAEYDAAITRGGSSPENRARCRQFRFAGVVNWKMSEIIAALPILLYCSVGLFWAGLIQWMWSVCHVVGHVVGAVTALAVLFYSSTTLLSAIYVSAPFHTPLSKGLYRVFRPPVVSVRNFLSFPRRLPWSRLLSQRASDAFTSISKTVSKLSSLLHLNTFLLWIAPHSSHVTSRQREDDAAGCDPLFEQRALSWLAEQLPISVDSHRRLGLLLNRVACIPKDIPLSPRFLEAPWVQVVEVLSRHWMQQVLNPAVTEYDYLELDVLLQCIELPYIRHNIIPSAEYEQDPKKNAYWERDYFKATSAANGVLASNESTACLLTRDLPRPTFGFENDFSSAIGLIKWRNTPGRKTATVWLDIFAHSHRYSSEFLHCCTNVFKMFMSTYKIHRWERVWLSAETNKEKSNQVMLALEGVDFLLRRDIDRFLHGDLTTFICRNMQHSSHRWPCISPCPDDLYKRLAKIRDPCLAIIGGYAFDAPVSVEETLSSDYTREYFYSLKRAYSLLYYNLSWIDKPDTWALRAAVWHSSPETVMMCEEALRKPETMRIFNSSSSRGHTVSIVHLGCRICCYTCT